MKNIALGVVLAGALCVIILQRIEIGALKASLASLESSDEDKSIPVFTESVVSEAGASVSDEEVARFDVVAESGLEAGEAAESESDRGSRMMRNFADFLDNPAYNKMMVASQKAALEVMYEDLIDFLVLDDKEKKYFLDLLVSRQMNQVQHAMKAMGGGLSDEERDEAQEAIKSNREEMAEEIEYFLNEPNDIEEWKFYEKTIEERMTLSGVEKELENSGLPLEPGVSRQLIEAMHDEKQSFDFSTDLHNQQSLDTSPERFSDENLASFGDDLERLDGQIAESVEGILTAEQLEIFIASLGQMRQLKLSQLEMAANMFRNSK